MTDQTKLAILCVLLVAGFVIWFRPDFKKNQWKVSKDVFQETQIKTPISFQEKDSQKSDFEKRYSLLQKTTRGEFGPSPFGE
jgi:hypothetical protein